MHAANVRLDVPVSVCVSERLTDDLREKLEDATLLSFETVIDCCIDRRVDYLLLSGNIFIEADRSLRARLALMEGFDRLTQHGIHVFVIPGDADPSEAWRAIPNLPETVHVCSPSDPQPMLLQRGTRIVAAVSASMWYGDTDAYGIRVIETADDGIEPFRIGSVTRSRFDESRRMAKLTETTADLLNPDTPVPVSDDGDLPPDGTTAAAAAENEYETAFRSYMNGLLREGRLSYLALGGQLERTWIHLESGVVHCPGTTQPRSHLECDAGTCSLITVDENGHVTCEEISTGAVDWTERHIELTNGMESADLLQAMRERIAEQPCSPSIRIRCVDWLLTGPLPVLSQFQEADVELIAGSELDELTIDGHPVRLLHQVTMLPDAWQLSAPDHLAQEYSDLIASGDPPAPSALMAQVRRAELSEGWHRRLESLVSAVDPRRVLAHIRSDGAGWFVEDLSELLPSQDSSESVTGPEPGTEGDAGIDEDPLSDDSEAMDRAAASGDEPTHDGSAEGVAAEGVNTGDADAFFSEESVSRRAAASSEPSSAARPESPERSGSRDRTDG